MAVTRFSDHFSGHSREYAAFRPSYPAEMIAHLAALAPERGIAWDCGTGSGQAALLLAECFHHVIATDASSNQISQAPTHPRIGYRVAFEDDSGQAGASVDLVTVAQALHWFDLTRFYREVKRVLKPNGVIAAWCYELIRVSPEVDEVVDWFYSTRVGRFWPPERVHVETGYRDLPFPFEELEPGVWAATARLTRRDLLGYVGTWSAVARAKLEDGADPVEDLAKALAPVWASDEDRRSVEWPLNIRIGHHRSAR